MSDLIKVTHLKRETFALMTTVQEFGLFGNWLKGRNFKDTTDAVQIRNDRETRERLKLVMLTMYTEDEVCIPHVNGN